MVRVRIKVGADLHRAEAAARGLLKLGFTTSKVRRGNTVVRVWTKVD